MNVFELEREEEHDEKVVLMIIIACSQQNNAINSFEHTAMCTLLHCTPSHNSDIFSNLVSAVYISNVKVFYIILTQLYWNSICRLLQSFKYGRLISNFPS